VENARTVKNSQTTICITGLWQHQRTKLLKEKKSVGREIGAITTKNRQKMNAT